MTEATADAPAASKTPMHLWIVGILSLLWNAFGSAMYTMASMGNEALLARMPPEMQSYQATMPIWAHAGWAIGVWGSLFGSLLLLARSRHAATAFAASLAGAVVSFAAQAQAGVLTPAEPVIILAVIVLQWWYARRQAAAAVLR